MYFSHACWEMRGIKSKLKDLASLPTVQPPKQPSLLKERLGKDRESWEEPWESWQKQCWYYSDWRRLTWNAAIIDWSFFVSSISFNSKVAILRLKKLAVGNFLEGDAPTQYVVFLISQTTNWCRWLRWNPPHRTMPCDWF